MKLSKQAMSLHDEAVALVEVSKIRRLNLDERLNVLHGYHEGATNMNARAGAFFTPPGLARDFAIEVHDCDTIVDLCAGIGALAFACRDSAKQRIVCVEQNPEYVAVGRAVMPDAIWVLGSVFDVAAYAERPRFDIAISNPPFGAIPSTGFEGRYTGSRFEYKVIETASRIAKHGTFLIPQTSAPFRYSGRQFFKDEESPSAERFRRQTGIVMGPNCGIDTTVYVDEWRGVSPVCEIVLCDFTGEAR